MQKQAPSLGRILVMVGFALSCFGLLLFLWLAFGGSTPLKPKGYRFAVQFSEATQLSVEADVRISGVSVGKVKTVEPDKQTGRSRSTIELDPKHAPLPRDTKAILRQKTLLGETYVELTPGNGKKAGFLPEDGELPTGQVADTVELDEIQRALDPTTRVAFQRWMQDTAKSLEGRGRDINDALGNLSPFAEDTSKILRVLNSQEGAVRSLVSNTGEVFTALSERDGQLRGLIENSNRVFQTTAERTEDLQETFRALPTFQREARRTVDRLTQFSRDTDPLITQLRPVAREFTPTFQQLEQLAPDLRALFTDIGPLTDAAVRGLPATERFLTQLRPFLGEFDPLLRQLNPALRYISDYKQELGAFFSNTVAATQASNIPPGGDVNTKVHYLRTTNPINLENLAVYPTRLPTNRTNPYPKPGAFRNLKDGLESYETRQCGNGPLPNFGGATTAFLNGLPSLVRDALRQVGTAALSSVAPPCKQQGKFDVGGELTQYPHLKRDTSGTSNTAVPAGTNSLRAKKTK